MSAGPLSPADRAMHYIRWHAAAYGAPAPEHEIADQLYKRHGLTETQTHDLLVGMRNAGKIACTDGPNLSGWHEAQQGGEVSDA